MIVVASVLAVGVGLVAFGVAPAPYVFGPLVGLVIWKVGRATFTSMRAEPAYVPDGSPPEPVDLEREQVVYRCAGCGTELLLLVRGTPVPPRHCGERMTEPPEVDAHDAVDRRLDQG